MTVLAALLALAGLMAGYVNRELADPDAFADRSVTALRSDAVRGVIAEEVALELLERGSPNLVATRPLVLVAVEALLETDEFARVFRRTAIGAHDLLVDGDRDVIVELGEARAVLLPVVASASPAIARQIPGNLRPQIAQIRSSDAATTAVRVADSTNTLAIPLLLGAIALMALAVATAPDRRRAAAGVGLAVAAVMAVGITGLAGLKEQVIAHTDAIGALGEGDTRAAAAAAWDALAEDLSRWLLVAGLGGVAVWAGALLSEARLDRGAVLRRGADVLAGGALPRPARAARGLALAAVGALLMLEVAPVSDVVVIGLGGTLVLLGLAEALALVGPARPHPLGELVSRRRLAVGAGGLATAGAAVAAVVLLTSGAPAPLQDDEVVGCNGAAALCDRRLDQVVFAGTHNSMSAADRPGWFFANQTRPIPRQLRDGVRLLLVDPHYGVKDAEGRIRTDLAADGTNRNRVASALGVDAVRAAERLGGRLGLVPAEGKQGIYLCHTLCELGAEPLSATLNDIRGWLEHNRSEVLVVLSESSVKPDELVSAFEKADLERYLVTLPRTGPLPTLRRLVTSGRRLVVLDAHDGGGAPWYQPQYRFLQDTSIKSFTESRDSCGPGGGTPEAPMLLMSNWVDRFPPPRAGLRETNASDRLLRRARHCAQTLGRRPNLIAVDFYERGGLLAAARELNGEAR